MRRAACGVQLPEAVNEYIDDAGKRRRWDPWYRRGIQREPAPCTGSLTVPLEPSRLERIRLCARIIEG